MQINNGMTLKCHCILLLQYKRVKLKSTSSDYCMFAPYKTILTLKKQGTFSTGEPKKVQIFAPPVALYVIAICLFLFSSRRVVKYFKLQSLSLADFLSVTGQSAYEFLNAK